MHLRPVKGASKAECGITSGLKLASHVAIACGSTSHYTGGLPYSLSTQDVSQRNGSTFEISVEDLQETGLRNGTSHTLGRLSRRDLYRSRDTLDPIKNSLKAVEASQAHRPPLLATGNVSNPNFSGPTCSVLRVADLRGHWAASQICQMSVVHLEWYEARNGVESFLLLEVLPALFTRGRPTWVRLERHPHTRALKALRTKPLVGHTLTGDTAILSKEKYDLLRYNDDSFVLKEAMKQTLPLSVVLDILDAVHKNGPRHSASDMSSSQLYTSIIMNAVHQFCAPAGASTINSVKAQSNNPYRILKHFADRKACDDIAQEIELQHGWELL